MGSTLDVLSRPVPWPAVGFLGAAGGLVLIGADGEEVGLQAVSLRGRGRS